MCKVAIIYGPQSSTYSFPNNHPMSGVRATSFWREIANRKLVQNEDLEIHEPMLASVKDLELFHTPEYIEFVRKSSERGIGLLDKSDTPAFKGVYEASRYVVGSTLLGLDLVMSKKVDHAFNPIGGMHHARADSASGFCVFNDASISINQAKRKYKLIRIAYVDIDAHHGDGVFYPFYDDPEVFIADIHEDGRYLFPGTGYEDEKGGGLAEGTKMAIPLKPYSGDEDFRKAFRLVETFLDEARPQLIVFQCGGDGLEEDPITQLKYTHTVHRYASDILHRLAHEHSEGRLLALGGGGYNPDNTAKAWVDVLESFKANL